nr:LlaJI family restriction endonuclease [Corynebacterium sp. 76QC2CO]
MLAKVSEQDRFYYNFCGVVAFQDFVFLLGPKYLKEYGFDEDHFALILKVLQKEHAYLSQIGEPEDLMESGTSRSALVLALVESYLEHGLLSRTQNYLALNGNGVTNWLQTISRCEPIFQNGRPLYLDVVTHQSTVVTDDLVSDIHKAVVAECLDIVDKSFIGQIVGIDDKIEAPRCLSEIGDREYLISALKRSLSLEFVTWKQETLNLLLAYVEGSGLESSVSSIFSLGTTAFNLVWERACKFVFSDDLKTNLPTNKDAQQFTSSGKDNKTLIDEIPKPVWVLTDGSENEAAHTLTPDTVKIGAFEGLGRYMLIVDAKYYAPTFEDSVENAPGIESITKQFLYQRAFAKFINENKIKQIANVFVFPSYGDCMERPAEVRLPGLFDESSPMPSKIGQWMIPAKDVFEAYISGTRKFGYELVRTILSSEHQTVEGSPLHDVRVV